MAFDEQDREELLSILDRQYKEARRCLNEDAVLPSSITYNGLQRRAGVTGYRIPYLRDMFPCRYTYHIICFKGDDVQKKED